MKRSHFRAVAAAVLLVVPAVALAESSTLTPAASGDSVSAKLDFRVIIPAVLYLRVGQGNGIAAANDPGVNLLSYTVPAANIGDSTVINADAGSEGDIGGGAVTVRVFSNVGTDVSLNSAVSGRLVNAAGDAIPWSEIAVAAAGEAVALPGWTNGAITHPAFLDTGAAGNGVATTLANVGKLVRYQGKWTFSYSNTAVRPAGTYGGVNAQNGRVTYTAALP